MCAQPDEATIQPDDVAVHPDDAAIYADDAAIQPDAASMQPDDAAAHASDAVIQPDDATIQSAVEALLFVSDEPVGAMTLAGMVDVDLERVQAALDALRARLAEANAGIQLVEVAGGWRLCTHPQHHELIERYVLSWDTRRLSQAALETLAVIAYNQPITRNGVVAVRGVNSDSPINSLVEKGLVREAGREQSPGQPILYATTRTFLEKFGLASVADLPDLEQFAPDEQSKALIRERLGVARSAAADQPNFEDGLSLDLGFAAADEEGMGASEDEGAFSFAAIGAADPLGLSSENEGEDDLFTVDVAAGAAFAAEVFGQGGDHGATPGSEGGHGAQ